MPLARLALLFLALPVVAQQARHEFSFARENVLGTRLALTVIAADADAAGKVESAVLTEIERLRRIASSWDADSELRQALGQSGPVTVSADLRAMLRDADRWREASGGAFHPGVQVLTTMWQQSAAAGREPDAAALAGAVATLRSSPWQIRGDRVTFAMPVCLDGLAKGQVLELASVAGERAVVGAEVALLMLGGDLRVRGKTSRTIAVVDPRAPADNGTPLAKLQVADRAVASSGGYARGVDIDGKHRSHIFDPRSGHPVTEVLGATVLAANAADADALATILCVLPPKAGLALIERTAGAAAVVVDRHGVVHTSRDWSQFVVAEPPPAEQANPRWPAGFELRIEFAIKKPDSGGRGYRRPYVAVWLEDAIGDPACSLALWIQKEKWLADLRRWHKHHRSQRGLIDALTQATRKPGAYELVWHGVDDDGRALAPGKFTVLIEAAREHGTYQLLKQEVTIGSEPFALEVAGNPEIEWAKVTFGPKKKP
ncbi:MAG: DUF2271 domain-containing protein [Planctomycetes bacterium]|nr:DUF2271 domain-containing protein [Planctomycetota bacterium]